MKQLIAVGLELHQQGSLAAAEQAYQAVLAREPSHADALHLLGLLTGRSDPEGGARLIERAIASNPRFSTYHNNLGNLLLRAGALEGAEQSYRQALRVDGRNADACLNLGKLLTAADRYQEARQFLRTALQLAPGLLEAHMSVGRLEQRAGDLPAALEGFRRAVTAAPAHAPAYLMLASACSALGRWEEAEANLQLAITLDPGYADAHCNLGNVQRERGRLAEALISYRRAIELCPSQAADAYNNLGVTLSSLGRHEEALAAWLEAIRIKPDYVDACFNLARETVALGHHPEGFALFARVLALDPAHAGAIALQSSVLAARTSLASVIAETGDPEGLALLEEIIRDQPLFAHAQWARGCHLLLHGRYEEGWAGMEWRYQVEALHIERRSFTQPPWQGEPLEGRPILLYAEEGFGDTLQFARYVPLVAERGGRVILDVQPGLRRLLRNLPGVAHCMAQAGEAMPAFAVHASLMSLPYLFRTTLDSIPPPVLSPEWPGLVLQPASKEGPLRVGLVWAGNPKHQRDSVRSIPLEQWRPLASIEGVSFTSLQKGPGELQIEEHGACFDFIGDSSRIKDFVDTAAVIVDLDLVITVDSAVAHLAGTMGKPVWILLDNTRDWRWGLESNKTPWYPSARLFRQTVPTDWRGVIEEVAAALAEQSARKSEAAAGG